MPPLLELLAGLVPIGVILFMGSLLWARGRDPERDSTTVEYEPPGDLTPAECGALLVNAVDMPCVTATLVDLSVKGFLTIDQHEAGEDTKDRDYSFRLIKPPSEWNALKAHEAAVLSAVFIPTNPLAMLSEAISGPEMAAANPAVKAAFSRVQAKIAASPMLQALGNVGTDPKEVVRLSELRPNFYMHLSLIRVRVFGSLSAAGYYVRQPDQVRAIWAVTGIGVGLVVAVAGGLLAKAAGADAVDWVLSGLITALVICGIGLFMPARTASGARMLARVRGFQNFLGRVEKDRIKRLDDAPQFLEKYLPYAMALRVESKWAEAFADIAAQPAEGQGRPDFFPKHLVTDLNAMPQKAIGAGPPG